MRLCVASSLSSSQNLTLFPPQTFPCIQNSLSQAPANSIQSSISLEFGEVFSKLRVKPKVRKAVKIRKLIDETTSYVRSAKTVVSGGGNSKYLSVRRAQVRDG